MFRPLQDLHGGRRLNYDSSQVSTFLFTFNQIFYGAVVANIIIIRYFHLLKETSHLAAHSSPSVVSIEEDPLHHTDYAEQC